MIRNEEEEMFVYKDFFNEFYDDGANMMDIWYEKKLYDHWVKTMIPEMRTVQDNLMKMRKIAYRKAGIKKRRTARKRDTKMRNIVVMRAKKELTKNKKEPKAYTRFWAKQIKKEK